MTEPTRPDLANLGFLRLDPLHSAQDLAVFQSVFRSAPSFVYLTGGVPPSDADAARIVTKVPPGTAENDMFYFALSNAQGLCGCAITLRNFPKAQTAYIALLLLVDAAQGQGLGRAAVARMEDDARSWGCTSLAGVVDSMNEKGLRFWQRQGFVETFRKPADGFMGDAVVINKIGF